MLIPLKLKYRTSKPRGFPSKSNNSKAKPKTIWKLLNESANRGRIGKGKGKK
jgi:hypothetical protein